MIHPLLSDDFATTGFQAVNPGRVTRFQVLGERSSGTNFVKRLLGRNTDLTPSEALGWKHGCWPLAIPKDFAVICVVRDARDWARSMHAKPWHTVPSVQALAFSDFLRSPWETVIDRPRYFAEHADAVGQPLQADRDPATGALFEDLFALRSAKLHWLLSFLGRGAPCLLLRTERAQADPEGTLAQMREALQLAPLKKPFRPVVKRLGAKFNPAIPDRPGTPGTWSDADLAHLRARIERDLEQALGYRYA